jgi:hypothetical protein
MIIYIIFLIILILLIYQTYKLNNLKNIHNEENIKDKIIINKLKDEKHNNLSYHLLPFYINNNNEKIIENFTATAGTMGTVDIDDNILRNMITDIYQMDITTLKNLSDLGNTLQNTTSGLTIPGNLTVSSNLNVSQDINATTIKPNKVLTIKNDLGAMTIGPTSQWETTLDTSGGLFFFNKSIVTDKSIERPGGKSGILNDNSVRTTYLSLRNGNPNSNDELGNINADVNNVIYNSNAVNGHYFNNNVGINGNLICKKIQADEINITNGGKINIGPWTLTTGQNYLAILTGSSNSIPNKEILRVYADDRICYPNNSMCLSTVKDEQALRVTDMEVFNRSLILRAINKNDSAIRSGVGVQLSNGSFKWYE